MVEEIDYKQLDTLAKSNAVAKQKQLDYMKNELRKSGNFFDFVSESKVVSYADRLQAQGFGVYYLKIALDKIIAQEEKFPSYKALRDVIRASIPKGVSIAKSPEHIAEDKEFERLKDMYIDVLGEDKIAPFCEWWVRNVLGMSKEELQNWGFDPTIFLRCALFDWRDANFKDFERIKQIGLKKMENVKKNLNK